MQYPNRVWPLRSTQRNTQNPRGCKYIDARGRMRAKGSARTMEIRSTWKLLKVDHARTTFIASGCSGESHRPTVKAEGGTNRRLTAAARDERIGLGLRRHGENGKVERALEGKLEFLGDSLTQFVRHQAASSRPDSRNKSLEGCKNIRCEYGVILCPLSGFRRMQKYSL